MSHAPLPNPKASSRNTDQELSILIEIGQILSSTLELRQAFGQVMQILSDKLSMRRGTLVLLDESTGRLHVEAAIGLSAEEIGRATYALGEGITGQVVATGRARLIPDLRREPDFLNRTKRIDLAGPGSISFICVPLQVSGRTVGALSVDKPFASDADLRTDQAFLEIVGALPVQTIQINRMVLRQK